MQFNTKLRTENAFKRQLDCQLFDDCLQRFSASLLGRILWFFLRHAKLAKISAT